MKLRDQIDQLLLSSAPHVSLPIRISEIELWIDGVPRRYPLLSEARRVLAAGSSVSGTAVEGSSGLDLVVVCDRFQDVEAERAIDIVESSLSGQNPIRTRHGVQVFNAEVGNVCFLPSQLPSPHQGLLIADGNRKLWLPAIPSEHAQAIRAQDELSRCVIRVAKCWSAGRGVPLESFHVEAIALESFAKSPDAHFPWKMKSFFDTARESLLASNGHPLCPNRVRFDYLSTEERRVALESIAAATKLANQAFLLTELEFDDDDPKERAENLQSAASAYALLLDPEGGR